jgi:hypothetical protein
MTRWTSATRRCCIVLLMLGGLPPLAWAYRLSIGIPWRSGETLSLSLSLALSALAIFSFVLIRRGRLQWAVRQLIAVVAVVVMLSYPGNGFTANWFEHPVQVTWLVIAGLMIGRKALWMTYGWSVLAFAIGVWRDVMLKVEAVASVADLSVRLGEQCWRRGLTYCAGSHEMLVRRQALDLSG